MTANPEVHDNQAAKRIELTVDGYTASIPYERAGRQIIFIHTEVPAELQGRGIGARLARGALDLARAREMSVVPLCPFVANYIRHHPEYLDLVSQSNRKRMRLE